MTKIKRRGFIPAEHEWLARTVNERKYYLHNRLGGRGWEYYQNMDGHYITIEDANVATMFVLKFGLES